MLKRIKLIMSVVVLLAISVTACGEHLDSHTNVQPVDSQCDVNTTNLSAIEAPIYVNGELIKDGVVAVFTDSFVEIPLISVFESLGAKIYWESENKANLVLNNQTYIVDVNALTLSKGNVPNRNYLFGKSGGAYILYAQDKEIILDSYTFVSLFERLGIDVHVNCDWEDFVVKVNAE